MIFNHFYDYYIPCDTLYKVTNFTAVTQAL